MPLYHCTIWRDGTPIATTPDCLDLRKLWKEMDGAWKAADNLERGGAIRDRRKLSITKTDKGWTVDERAQPGTPPVGRDVETWQNALINWFVANAASFGFEFDYFDHTESRGAEFPSDV